MKLLKLKKQKINQSIYAEYFGNHLKKNEDIRLFGMDIVNNAKDKIIPTSISKDYILGVGDIISVKIWSDLFTGNADSSQILPMEVSKNGTLFIPNVGSFFVNGKSIKTFEKDLIAEARKKVKFFNAEVSLEKIREISIFVVGEVNLPGHLLVNSYGNLLNVLQKSGGIFNPKVEDISLQLGDEVYVYNYNDINNKAYANVNGAILKEGNYEIYDGSRVLNLIYSARGLDESKNPFMNRADLYRVDEEGRLKVFKIDLNKLLNGDDNENILLKRSDVLKVYTYDEVIKHDDIFIYGEVREEGKYRYYQNMTLEDIVFYSKGLQNKADNNIIINRHENNKIKEYVIDIERNPDFKILPGDIVFVRKKADWIESKLVKIEGFVRYPGVYQLNPRETMNTLITRAGGFKTGAFPQGTKFTRKKEDYIIDEKTKETKVVESFENVSNFDFNDGNKTYVRDIELVDGDAIYIPEKPTTVKIEGEVYTPGLIVFDSKMDNYKDYVEAAGGYKETAYKKRTFVIKANGKTVAKPSKTKIEPGDTIYVPLDAREKKGLDRGIELFKGTLEIVSTVALIILLF